MKLTKDDIKILSEGMQVRKVVLDRYETIENFISSNDLLISPDTLKNYMREKVIKSEKFKCSLVRIFNQDYSKIALNEKDQIANYADDIAQNIVEYTEDTDIEILEYMRDRCLELHINVPAAKMYRSIGMYNFYRNNGSAAIDCLKLAVSMVENRNENSLLISFLSELGLIYFYEVQYVKAKQIYDIVDSKISKADNLDNKIRFLHYYRKGVLHNNTSEYTVARDSFQNALKYASNNHETGTALMNIGLTFKKQGRGYDALKYYEKSLEYFIPDNTRMQSVVYNNMAEVYKIQENYKKAIIYINMAIDLLDDRDIKEKFIALQTHAEIMVLKGETENAFGKLLDFLSGADNFFTYKKFVIAGISLVMNYGGRDKNILNNLKEIIKKLIQKTTPEEYKIELKACLCDILLLMYE
jgi:tetratricopeptide (TPR) repeat protein